MKPELMDILACPTCKWELKLTVTKENCSEIVEGNLYCSHCKETYPIENSVPILLPARLRD